VKLLQPTGDNEMDPPATADQYVYEPLSYNHKYCQPIRLLKILPGDPDSLVCCELFKTYLSTSESCKKWETQAGDTKRHPWDEAGLLGSPTNESGDGCVDAWLNNSEPHQELEDGVQGTQQQTVKSQEIREFHELRHKWEAEADLDTSDQCQKEETEEKDMQRQ
jgi:hypothetical protein